MSEDIKTLEILFHRALELEEPARDAFIAGQDEPLRSRLRALFAHVEAPDTIARIVGGAAAIAVEPEEHAGPYRMIACLGQGGMGSVYLATRADNAFEKSVAIKFVRAGVDSPPVRGRFEAERRILARLEHPAIARLLDAGTTAAGVPYLVMEYVESAGNIVAYCHRGDVPFEQRLRIFRQVCDAVQYAHRNLVIHRDLKPSNILVNRDGVPKLLDFGIAKIIGAGEQTVYTQAGWMTPRYSSPEQCRGEPVSTASDVYSLGVILGELLEGQAEARDARLIAAKATREDAAERYETAAALAADIAAVLDHRPISAREYSRAECLLRFARRNRGAVAAAALGVCGLLLGTALAVRSAMEAQQARAVAVAEKQRAERESAEAERQATLAAGRAREAQSAQALADRRYSDARRLTGAFVHDIYGEISQLSGATKARGKMLAAIVSYLEGLSAQNPHDDIVQLDLARAYRQAAEFEGGPGNRAGDVQRALAKMERARAILARQAARHPGDPATALELVDVASDLAKLRTESKGDVSGVRDIERENLAEARVIARAHPTDLSARVVLIRTMLRLSFTELRRWPGKATAGLAIEAEAIARGTLASEASRRAPAVRELLEEALADAISAQGQVHALRGRFAIAIEKHRESLRLRQSLAVRYPVDARYQRNVMLSWAFLANIYAKAGQPNHPDARTAVEGMAAIAKELVAADPESNGARMDLAMSGLRMAAFLSGDGRLVEAAGRERESVGILAALAEKYPENFTYHQQLVGALRQRGDTLLAMGDNAEAVDVFERMLEEAERLEGRVRSPSVLALESMALVRLALLRTLDGADATALADRSVEIQRGAYRLEPTTNEEGNLARAMARAGEVYALAARRTGNREHWRRASELLGAWAAAESRLPPSDVRPTYPEGSEWRTLFELARNVR
ncbi:MAG: serine/threonine-protein kinase [Bryobacteraceae bacterium]